MPDEKKITLLDPDRVDEVVEDQRKLRDGILALNFGTGGAAAGAMLSPRFYDYKPGAQARGFLKANWRVPVGALVSGAAGYGLSRLTHGDKEEQEKIMRKKVQERVDLARRMGYTPELTANPHDVNENLIRALKGRETRGRKALQKTSFDRELVLQRLRQLAAHSGAGAASGGATGASTAAATAPEGERLEAALHGGLLGAGTGAAFGGLGTTFTRGIPAGVIKPQESLRYVVGGSGILGGVEGGFEGLSRRFDKRSEKMKKQSNELLEGFDSIDPATEAEINRKLASLRKQYDFKKSAALKAAVDKQAIIDKDVKSNFDQDLDELTDKEPELPKEVQDMMGDRISDALSTAGGAVIIIKPKEFQRMYLRGIGRSDLGEELDSKGMCFKPGAPPDPHFGLSGKMMPDILKMLMPMIMGRSAASPCVNRRIMMIKVVKKPEGDPIELDHPLMDKISSAYSSYRRDLLYNLPTLIKSAMEQPEFRDFWYLDGPPSVTGVVKQGSDVMESLVQMLPVSYTNRAHFQAPISAYVDENPSLDGLIDAGTLI